LDELSKSILEKILKLSITHPTGLNATRFRAERHEHLDLLDALESDRYLEKKNDNYYLTLLALLELSDSFGEAKNLMDKCEHIFKVLQQFYIEHPGESINLNSLSEISNMPRKDINNCLAHMVNAIIFQSRSNDLYSEDAVVSPDERILRYRNFREMLEQLRSWNSKNIKNIKRSKNQSTTSEIFGKEISSKNIWNDINKEFGIRKPAFGKRINFVTDDYKRGAILRDIEQAYVLFKIGYYKPSVILAGSVIEELLRIYLESKNVKSSSNSFDAFIKTCEENRLLRGAVSSLLNSVRQFRNLVHLENEKSQKDAISIATTQSAVASIFIISKDF